MRYYLWVGAHFYPGGPTKDFVDHFPFFGVATAVAIRMIKESAETSWAEVWAFSGDRVVEKYRMNEEYLVWEEVE